MALTVALLVLGGLLGLVGYAWLVVAAFRISVGWGLAVLLLGWTWVPLILFAARHWPEARRPLLVWAVGFVLLVAAWAVVFSGLAGQTVPSAGAPTDRPDPTGRSDEPQPGILPPPRPPARPTPPSWEAILDEMVEDGAPVEEVGSWEELVPDRSADASVAASIPWQELARYTGRRLEIHVANGTEVTAQLVAVEPDRIRIRHVVGGGVVAYWITRDQVLAIRPPR